MGDCIGLPPLRELARGMKYPSQMDCVWLAADADGRLAAFVTAGEGPIPEALLTSSINIELIENLLLQLEIVGTAVNVTGVPNPNSFIELSRRGLFVYDWTDVYVSERQASGAYELVASPSTELLERDLPANLLQMATKLSQANSIGRRHLRIT